MDSDIVIRRTELHPRIRVMVMMVTPKIQVRRMRINAVRGGYGDRRRWKLRPVVDHMCLSPG